MKNKNQLQPDRLRKLALYLQGNEVRDIQYVIEDEPEYIDHGDFVEKQVSFYYQAIVESIFIFRKEWKIDERGHVYWVKDPEKSPLNSALLFYGLTDEQFQHLFIPNYQRTLLYGGRTLGNCVHPREIGENIMQFLDRITILSN